MAELSIRHNAGFFSCCTIRLIEIIKFFNQHKRLPASIDDKEQFAFFKKNPEDYVVPEFFKTTDFPVEHTKEVVVTEEPGEVSFGDYSKLHFEDVNPFLYKYFSPSDAVWNICSKYEANYQIDFQNTCAIFYRGNDKKRECEITPYEDFINKAQEVLDANPDIRFLVQPDETEFLQAFTKAFPGRCFNFKETPHMRRKDSAIFYELPSDKKMDHGQHFLAAVLTMSRCKHVITHSGNGGMFCVLYRGNFDNVFQFRNKHIY